MALQTWITDRFTSIGNQLGFTTTDYQIIVADTLELLEITDESSVDAIVLHSIAKVVFWRKCLDTISLDYSFSSDGSSYSRSDMFEHISKSLQMAESDAMNYLPNYVIEVGSLTVKDNPYDYSKVRDEHNNL